MGSEQSSNSGLCITIKPRESTVQQLTPLLERLKVEDETVKSIERVPAGVCWGFPSHGLVLYPPDLYHSLLRVAMNSAILRSRKLPRSMTCFLMGKSSASAKPFASSSVILGAQNGAIPVSGSTWQKVQLCRATFIHFAMHCVFAMVACTPCSII